VVITSNERAADLATTPVRIAAASGAGLFEQEIATDHYRPDLSVMDGSVALAARLFDRFDVTRDDIDVAMIYDAFSPILLMQLEALGFCGPGEAKDFIADGNLALDGALPVQHQRRSHRGGIHPRAEPGPRSDAPTPRDCRESGTRRDCRLGDGEPDRRSAHDLIRNTTQGG